ncbi:hypothetical protein METHB2_10150 [Candidatus Methylobacter favarea]|uniref:Uncharacterized protein n=1 Tax=Candidatus Methylobacter favarea TaxID=2707345 RepID=A0A8S0WLN7_9GAMM|nr:hypothetical protein [Candidatus Methylobacter favarea]CAA9889310.1 hypothetical protein METHB2_10150 [Candidatus Methylobacter favarea]
MFPDGFDKGIAVITIIAKKSACPESSQLQQGSRGTVVVMCTRTVDQDMLPIRTLGYSFYASSVRRSTCTRLQSV